MKLLARTIALMDGKALLGEHPMAIAEMDFGEATPDYSELLRASDPANALKPKHLRLRPFEGEEAGVIYVGGRVFVIRP